MKHCETCGEPLVRHPKHSDAQWLAKRFCDRLCANVARRIERSCACGCGERPLVGRKYVRGHRPLKPTSNGYRRVWAPGHPMANRGGVALEHRLVLHNAGVAIPKGTHVHHRNGDKLDNRLENLEVLTAREHARRHIEQEGSVLNQFGTWPLRDQAEACR